MTILLLGGSKAKTSIRLAALLSQGKHAFILASRSQSPSIPYPQATFDWLDVSTYTNPFDEVSKQNVGSGKVDVVYLVAPPVTDMGPPMKAFIDLAVQEKGVRRFVLLSASSLERGGLAMGQIHDYLAGLVEKSSSSLEYAVLKPTWFMENFSEGPALTTIQSDSKIFSATQDGKIPFISADDIAAVAYHALTDAVPLNGEYVVLGPELLSYDDIASTLSSTLNRVITHVKLSEPQFAAGLAARGIPRDYATMLAAMDAAIARGSENRLDDTVLKVTGKPPKSFGQFAAEKKAVWG